jgi:hypothetical protein
MSTMKLERAFCGDCGVLEGQNHRPLCDLVHCPRCSGQRLHCGCDLEEVPFIEYPQMCAKCGEMWPDMFMVPHDEWCRYIEIGERDKMLCRSCFDQIKAWIDEAAVEAAA